MIKKVKMIDPVSCRQFAHYVQREILLQTPLAVNRRRFWTLGAASDLARVHEYPAKAELLNPLMGYAFGDLIMGTCQIVCMHRGIDPEKITFLDDKALPGFHYFDSGANGETASIHCDEPYKQCMWPCEYHSPSTFTSVLALPECGGGLNVWPEGMPDAEVHKTEPTYLPYEIGHMYLHTGHIPHQIANRGRMKPGESRITLQGHTVTLDDGRVVFYF